MAKRHFLMLANNYTSNMHVRGWYVSEKLDGMRAFRDGGATRGLRAASVPFANTEKDSRLNTEPYATGLWSRYGKVIHAPSWWLDSLPDYPLDGELYIGRSSFQKLVSIVKQHQPGPGWKDVTYQVFDIPPPHVVFGDGVINETNFKKTFSGVLRQIKVPAFPFKGVPQYRTVQDFLQNQAFASLVNPLAQVVLWESSVGEMLEVVLKQGGEGIMVRNPSSIWVPNRVNTLLKVKGILDAEASVVGYTWGRETELGSKLLGLMGALVVEYQGRQFELSGFTESERVMAYRSGSDREERAASVGRVFPGKSVIQDIHNPLFPVGSTVTFQYREMTRDGIPKEARYWRKPSH